MRMRRAWWTVISVLAALALAACGGGSSSSSTTSSSGNGIASKSPDQILAATRAAIDRAKSVHVTGSLSAAGQMLTVDLQLVNGRGGRGQMSEAGLSFQVVALPGTVYVKGSQNFWRHFGGAIAAQLFQNKWLKGPAVGPLASLASLTNLPRLFDDATASHGRLSKGPTTTVDGRKVVPLTDTQRGGTLYVAATGQPYPVEISKAGSQGGKLVFDHYNEAVSLRAPKNAIDISQFKQVLG